MDHQNIGYASLIPEQDMRKERLIAVLENGAPNVQAQSVLDRYQERMEGQAEFALNYVAPEKKERK